MSTSLLYHAFAIRGFKYTRTAYDNGKVIFQHLPRARDLPLFGLRFRPASSLGVKLRNEPLFVSAHRRPGTMVVFAIPRPWNVRRVTRCVRSRSSSLRRGGVTPNPSRDTRWSCRGA